MNRKVLYKLTNKYIINKVLIIVTYILHIKKKFILNSYMKLCVNFFMFSISLLFGRPMFIPTNSPGQ